MEHPIPCEIAKFPVPRLSSRPLRARVSAHTMLAIPRHGNKLRDARIDRPNKEIFHKSQCRRLHVVRLFAPVLIHEAVGLFRHRWITECFIAERGILPVLTRIGGGAADGGVAVGCNARHRNPCPGSRALLPRSVAQQPFLVRGGWNSYRPGIPRAGSFGSAIAGSARWARGCGAIRAAVGPVHHCVEYRTELHA